MKSLLMSIFLILICLSCKKGENDVFVFPTRIKELNKKEIITLSSKDYFVSINSRFQGFNHGDTVSFSNDGIIKKNSKKIGTWQEDRMLKIQSNLFNSYISYVGNENISINRDSYLAGKDSIVKWEFLILKTNLKKDSLKYKDDEIDF